jgi:hypothetical protein
MPAARLIPAALSAALIAGSALAADSGSTLVFGNVLENCTVTAPPASTVSVISLDIQPIGNFSYTCNFIGPSASIRFWSTNGGALVNPDSGSETLPYRFNWQGLVTNADLTNTEITAAVVAVNPGAPANSVTTLAASIALDDTATVAGTFSDTIFISIAP